MRKTYAAPMLFVDEYAPDTMIASGSPKNDNADNNQNCWGCNTSAGSVSGENACAVTPEDALYAYC